MHRCYQLIRLLEREHDVLWMRAHAAKEISSIIIGPEETDNGRMFFLDDDQRTSIPYCSSIWPR